MKRVEKLEEKSLLDTAYNTKETGPNNALSGYEMKELQKAIKDAQAKIGAFDQQMQNIEIKVEQLIEKDIDLKLKKLEEENEIKIVSF